MRRKISKDGKWAYHNIQYLIENVPTGTFYVRKRVGRKTVVRSLQTTSISEARDRLPSVVAALKKEFFGTPIDRDLPHPPAGYVPKDEVMLQLPKSVNLDPGKATMFREAAAIFLDEVNSDLALSHTTKIHRSSIVRQLLILWEDLGPMRMSDLTEEGCRTFFVGLAKRYSPTHYNMVRWVFRCIVKIMRDRDARLGLKLHDDPTERIRRLGVRLKDAQLPTREQFAAVLDWLDSHAPKAGFVVRLAAYTGCRWLEGILMRWGDIDFRNNQIKVWSAKRRKVAGPAVYRHVPMTADARELLTFWSSVLKPLPQDRVVPGRRIEGQLARACSAVGIPTLRFNDLRHLFAIRCIEAGADIPTVSRWLGHLDGGGLALRVYGHLRAVPSPQSASGATKKSSIS